MTDTSEAARRPTDPATGRRRDQRSRTAILGATVELLQEVGYPRLTMEGVATRAGVGKATVYRWWPSKSALVVEAMTERMPLAPVHETGDIRADLHAAIETAVATWAGLPTGVIIPALAVDLMEDPAAAEHLREFIRPRRASVLRLLRNAAERGELADDADAALMFDIYAGTILYRFLVSGEPITGRVVNQLVELLLGGRVPTVAAE